VEVAVIGFVGHIDAAAGRVVHPAVVGAADAFSLGATVEERRAAVRAVRLHQANGAIADAKRGQLFAEQPDVEGRCLGGGKLGGEQERNPVMTQRSAHGRAVPDAGQELIVGDG